MKEMPPTIVDVLENCLGNLSEKRIDALTATELEELAERVNDFYSAWEAPTGDELRCYAGGWIAGNFTSPEALAYLYTTLVYYPATIIHDPIADWFFPYRKSLDAPPGVWSQGKKMQVQGSEVGLLNGDGYFEFVREPDRTRSALRHTVPVLRRLANLIRAGIVLPVPQWWIVRQRQAPILTGVRYDVRDEEFVAAVQNPVDVPAPRGDRIRGLGVTPDLGWAPGEEARGIAQDASYFANKTLAIADATNSLYVPPAATDAKLMEIRGRRVGGELRRHKLELQIAPALASAELPFLDGLDPNTLLAIRRDEAAFADWRAELRTAIRTIQATHSEGLDFEAEARDVLTDALMPRAHEVERLVSRSAAFRRVAKERVLEFGLGAASIGLVTHVGHHGFDTAALTALGVSATARWFLSPLLRPSPGGSKAVLATLILKSK